MYQVYRVIDQMGFLFLPLFAVGLIGWYSVFSVITQIFNRKNNQLEENHPIRQEMKTIRLTYTLAPMIGLLGTVWGIHMTFRDLAEKGSYLNIVNFVNLGNRSNLGDGFFNLASQSTGFSSQLVSPGISQALLTTQFGLLIALPLLLVTVFLQNRIENG